MAFSPAKIAKMVRLYQDGESAQKLGRCFGVKHSTILRVLRDNGELIRSRTDSICKLTSEQQEHLIRRRKEGANIKTLMRDFGTTVPLPLSWGAERQVYHRARHLHCGPLFRYLQ